MASQLLLVVRLSSERARQEVRQDSSFGKKQESRSALLIVVRSSDERRLGEMLALPRERACHGQR